MVSDNDLYYKASIKTGAVERLTRTGVPGAVYNGVADWLYEEEILGSEAGGIFYTIEGSNLLFILFHLKARRSVIVHFLAKY